MSSLIFYTDPQQVLVATDTLAASPDGNPMLFTSKAHYLPHLRTIIAGTGLGGFSVQWALTANSEMIVKGIENLDYHTPQGLKTLWAEHEEQYALAGNMTTTVYQFGLSEDTAEMVAFAYRSENNFMSERLGYGIGVKPKCSIPGGNPLEHIETMMNEQREIQSTVRASERIHIGGEAVALHLTKDACMVMRLFEFPDFRANQSAIFREYERNRER